MKKIITIVIALMIVLSTCLIIYATGDYFNGRGNTGNYGPSNKDWLIYGDEGGGCGTVFVVEILDENKNTVCSAMDIIRPWRIYIQRWIF